MSISNLSANGVTCNASGITMTLTANGSVFTGNYGGVLSCGPTGGVPDSAPVSGTIINGVRNGTQVSFDLDTSDAHHTGTISGNSMSGTASYRFNFGSGPVVLSGSWAAAR